MNWDNFRPKQENYQSWLCWLLVVATFIGLFTFVTVYNFGD